MKQGKVLEWLLEDSQPTIRALALRELMEKPESDPDLKSARAASTRTGWVNDILSYQSQGGWWQNEESLYRPKYLATNWMLLALADLGVTKEEPRVGRACELWIKRFAKPDGGFGTDNQKKSELCLVGNTARALVQFGYADHPKVRSAFEWLVENQKPNGGWHCWGKNGIIDGWEGMSAFAVYPRRKWTRGMKRAVERGAEFYLERELHKEGKRYGPWYRFHFPNHYYYDLLIGLDFMTALGYADDRRLRYAISLLMEKRRKDGKWNLDALQPDVEGSKALAWYKKYAKNWTPLKLENPGRPSKMITLRCMRVMKRAGKM